MSLFNFKKKKEEKPCYCCGGNCSTEKTTAVTGKVENIKVLGAGCKACHTQYENVQKAVENLGLNAEVEYITDMEKVMTYGVMTMPAIVVNEDVVSSGKILKADEVEKLLNK
jgi:small redox-active disulfide protein 2